METVKKVQHFLPSANCPVRNILARLGDKWSILVLVTLDANGTMRFGEIQKSIGDISQRMLTVTLRTLAEDGLLVRTAYPEIPPRVEYRLTPTGKSLMPHVNALVEWALEHLPAILSRRNAEEKRE